ncbi:MAG: hypothetical protein U0L88_06125 [Acutalibacteraceae bacterium]|nr:hypothetical protein [Acutalibacteraceae bacterium]
MKKAVKKIISVVLVLSLVCSVFAVAFSASATGSYVEADSIEEASARLAATGDEYPLIICPGINHSPVYLCDENNEVIFDEDGDIIEPKLKVRLIINGFRHRDAYEGIRSGVYDIISKTSVKLLGVVPYDENMAQAQETGKLAYQIQKGEGPSNIAFKNIALRLDGASVPLLSGLMGKRSRRKIL